MGHIGNTGGTGKPVVIDFLAQPDRQHRDGRCPEIVEVNAQEVEEADALQPVNSHIHAHQPGNGAGRAHQRHLATHGKGGEYQAGQSTADKISHQESPRTQRFFHGKTQQEQEQKVTNNVAPAAMQELVGNERVQRELCRHQSQLISTHPADPLLLNRRALLQPKVALGRGPDQIPVLLQILVKLTIQQQRHRLPEFFLIFLKLLEFLQLQNPLLAAFELDFPLQVVFVGGGLQGQQIALQIVFQCGFELAVVSALVEQKDQQAGHDQAQGYPGWAFPVYGILGRNNQHGRSQFIIICP